LSPKDKVLILGGSGGTGTFAIQYAKKVLDLHVIVTCSEKNIELCKSLGADEVIDYKKENFSTKLKEIDFVFGKLTFNSK
jgi:NADPH:quinone reductase-like Zn-dependent oxidoreductase